MWKLLGTIVRVLVVLWGLGLLVTQIDAGKSLLGLGIILCVVVYELDRIRQALEFQSKVLIQTYEDAGE